MFWELLLGLVKDIQRDRCQVHLGSTPESDNMESYE